MTKKVFLKLLPILVIYLIIFTARATNSIQSYANDEVRYVMFAENLSKGFYAPPDTLFLWNGPGYPLLLAPFAFFHIPWYCAKMLNPIFMFIAVYLLYIILRNYMSERMSLFFSYLFGFYPSFFVQIWYLYTESFILMLMAAFALFTTRWLTTGKYRFMLGASVIFAYIILTQVFFAYVAYAVILLGLILSKWSVTCRKTIPIYAAGLLLCTPYLVYTYSITGKVFYWANSGGASLYWLSSPYPDECGDWQDDSYAILRCPDPTRHKPLFEKLAKLDFVRQDELLKKQALENIINNPGKMVFNWACNVARLFLYFPLSHRYHKPRVLLYIVPNSILFGAMLFCVYPLIKLRRHLPKEIIHSIGLTMIFIAGHSLLCAIPRYLCPVIPFLCIVIAYTTTNLVKVEYKIEQQNNE